MSTEPQAGGSQAVWDAKKRKEGKALREAAIERKKQLRDRRGALAWKRKAIVEAAVAPTETQRRLYAVVDDRAKHFASKTRGEINAGRVTMLNLNDKGALEYVLDGLLKDAIDRLCDGERGFSESERTAELARIDNEIAEIEAELRTLGG